MDIKQKVEKTIEKYKLLSKRDKVVVALSGGKDSTSVLYILNKLGFKVEALFIDLYLGDWSKKNKENVEKFCKQLGVKLTIFDMKKEFGSGICFIKDVARENKGMTGCSVCGVTKRWILNKWAKKLKADKLVTGHNLDDECQTVLMNFLKGNVFLGINSSPATGEGKVSTQMKSPSAISPTLNRVRDVNQSRFDNLISDKLLNKKIKNYKRTQGSPDLPKAFVQRVKPLFFVPESEIRKYSKKMKFPVLYERCPCAFGTYRVETRDWMDGISDKEKLKIVEAWQKIALKLRAGCKTEIKKCSVCGEPTSGEVCKMCEILSVRDNS